MQDQNVTPAMPLLVVPSWRPFVLQRLEAVTRSPVYSQLSETLDGLVTIRAFGTQRESKPLLSPDALPAR